MRPLNIHAIALISLFTLLLSSHGNIAKGDQGELELSLNQAIEIGLSKNFDLLINQLEHQQVGLRKDQSVSAFLPQINGSFTHSAMDEKRADLQNTARSSGKWQVTLQQAIYNAEAIAAYSMMDQNQVLSQKNQTSLKESIVEKIILGYIEVLKAVEILFSQEENLENYEKLKKLAKFRYQVQETGKRDLLLVEMEYNNARIDLLNAKESLRNAETNLNLLLNFPPGTKLKVQKVNSIDPFLWSAIKQSSQPSALLDSEKLKQFLDQAAIQQSVQIKIAEEQLKMAQFEKSAVTAKFQPGIAASATWFQQAYAEHKEFTAIQEESYNEMNEKGWNASVTVGIPIFAGGGRITELKEKNLNIIEKTRSLEQTKAKVAQDLYYQKLTHFLNLEREQATRKVFKSAKENLELGELSYKEGSLSIMDLLDLQAAKIKNGINSITRKYQSRASLTRLLKLTGHLPLASVSSETTAAIKFRKHITHLLTPETLTAKLNQ